MEPKKKKVLLIDDNEIIRLMFSNVFWLHGLDDSYELSTVSHIEEAEVFISNPTTQPDIIFMGLVMPFQKNGKTETSAEAGFSMLKRIKSDSKTKTIRVVIFSSYNDEEYRERAIALGAEIYLKKGENMPEDLIQIIRSFDTQAK